MMMMMMMMEGGGRCREGESIRNCSQPPKVRAEGPNEQPSAGARNVAREARGISSDVN